MFWSPIDGGAMHKMRVKRKRWIMLKLTHKGYVGSAEFSADDGVFHGKVALPRDLVSYESATAKKLPEAFRDAVDSYLADCMADGRAAHH
jgi:predicted HicB family RNase H-like nuclease